MAAKVIQEISCPECGVEYTVDFGDDTPQQIVFCGACGEILAEPDDPEAGWDDEDDAASYIYGNDDED